MGNCLLPSVGPCTTSLSVSVIINRDSGVFGTVPFTLPRLSGCTVYVLFLAPFVVESLLTLFKKIGLYIFVAETLNYVLLYPGSINYLIQVNAKKAK